MSKADTTGPCTQHNLSFAMGCCNSACCQFAPIVDSEELGAQICNSVGLCGANRLVSKATRELYGSFQK